jgi:oxaloacetate decarboxylase alpha subunit
VGRVRAEAGWPPLAAPIGQILASQALLHVLEARRYGTVIDEFRALVQGGYGVTPEPVDPTVERAVGLLSPRAAVADDPPTTEDVREQAEGLAASEEELVLIAMFGADAEELLRMIRGRHSRDAVLVAEDEDAERAERIRELVKIVQESGVGEIEIEDEGMRVSVRRADEPATHAGAAQSVEDGLAVAVEPRVDDGVIRVESPMVGVFYRAPNPGAPAFVDIGDTVVPGQTLCVLEAMKLFNELKAEVAGTVASVHAENAQPVEYGQLLFEIEPVLAPPAL